MQNLVKLYEQNHPLIEKFIASSLKRAHLMTITNNSYPLLKESFPSLELIYACDKEMNQLSANFGDKMEDETRIGENRAYLIDLEQFNGEFFATDPYISSLTGTLCITVVFKYGEDFLFLDFNLRSLLERFHLIEGHSAFRMLSRISYGVIGGGLLLFGLFVVFYGIGSFLYYLFSDAEMSLEVVFKPVIALTLGLAVFDLGKTIYEQEVIPRTQNISEVFNPKSLVTFMVSIIIALLIEALLIVFKISINDYKDLYYAAALILAISALLYVFSKFISVPQSTTVKPQE
ncbi:MAG: hypothetical protein PF439_06650 [Helicobacteraceae bacterium]|jgi:hypothetical protein|nr:hypothetical protein [Helicobacteraceae bacterium]